MKLSFTFDQIQLSWQVSKRVSAEHCHLTVSPAQVTWDQALFSFRFENYIPAGKREPLKLDLISGYGSSVQPIEVTCFFESSADQLSVLIDRRLRSIVKRPYYYNK